MDSIRRFEYWLKAGRFIPLAILLILLNTIVYYWWKRPVVLDSPQSINSAVIGGLQNEKARVQRILDGNCDSPEMGQYQRGEIGPLNPGAIQQNNQNNKQVDNSVPKSQNDLVSMLEMATVRIVVPVDKNSVLIGTGFFISDDLIVTNRHVVAGGDPNNIMVTSKYLGGKQTLGRVIASTPDTKGMYPDFALIKVRGLLKAIKPLAVGDDPPILQSVYAAGFPPFVTDLDINQTAPSTVYSHGEVSVVQKQATGLTLVIHTANITHGNSGGPLVNNCVTLVGVNTFGRTEIAKGEVDKALYALSASSLRQFLDANQAQYTKSSSQCGKPAPTQ